MKKRCIRQSALIVERNVKFPSNPTVADQYTAENATLSEDLHAGIKLTFQLFEKLPRFLFFTVSDNKQNVHSSMRL
jgi:hypothetical protein